MCTISTHPLFQCSSASRKFLNIGEETARAAGSAFQCSSASRKFLNYTDTHTAHTDTHSFSALQRAENFSIEVEALLTTLDHWFQCSSASRKFLNVNRVPLAVIEHAFQCSSASRKFLNRAVASDTPIKHQVSVLFSEPKISQSLREFAGIDLPAGFSALQRAENFSM